MTPTLNQQKGHKGNVKPLSSKFFSASTDTPQQQHCQIVYCKLFQIDTSV